jgi:hypothetical protein
MTDEAREETRTEEEPRYQSAFPDGGQGQLGEPIEVESPAPVTIVDPAVQGGLGNAVENSQVRTRNEE